MQSTLESNHCVYKLVTPDGVVRRVGDTNNPERREREHAREHPPHDFIIIESGLTKQQSLYREFAWKDHYQTWEGYGNGGWNGIRGLEIYTTVCSENGKINGVLFDSKLRKLNAVKLNAHPNTRTKEHQQMAGRASGKLNGPKTLVSISIRNAIRDNARHPTKTTAARVQNLRAKYPEQFQQEENNAKQI